MFQFQRFIIEDDHSTMKVGTDSMILGAWAKPPRTGKILDIGTGCGILSLMLAQKSLCTFTAIDIHGPSVDQASENFKNSPWGNRMKALTVALEEFSTYNADEYDMIISNPPYFNNALASPIQHRNEARHDHKLTLDDLVIFSRRILKPEGRLDVILPAKESEIFEVKAVKEEFSVARKLLVYSRETDLQPIRVIIELSKKKIFKQEEEKLVIRNHDGTFDPGYLHLTKEFHKFIQ